jgi:hypothetical protein
MAPEIPDDGIWWADVRDVFRRARLDPSNPDHWPLVVKFCLADINYLKNFVGAIFTEYLKKSRPGTPQKWTADELKKLIRDFAQIQNECPHIKSDSRLCRMLAEREGHKGERAKQRGRTLHRRLLEARKMKPPLSKAQLDWMMERFINELLEKHPPIA